MTGDELIHELAKVYAGLQVPVSLGMPIGESDAAWRKISDEVTPFGWLDLETVEKSFRELFTWVVTVEGGNVRTPYNWLDLDLPSGRYGLVRIGDLDA